MRGAQPAVLTPLVHPDDAANSAGATSGWVAVAQYEGDVCIVVQVGAITAGSIAMVLQDATDDQGAGAATMAMNEGVFAAFTANSAQKRTVKKGATRGFIRLLATIVTGPVQVAACIMSQPKNP